MKPFGREQRLYKYAIRRKPVKPKPVKPKLSPEQKDTSIFQGKEQLKRTELREKLRKASPFIPGYGRKVFSKKERVVMEKELFPPGKYWKRGRYGYHYVSRKGYEGTIKGLEKAKSKARGPERFEIDRKIKFLRGLLKKEP